MNLIMAFNFVLVFWKYILKGRIKKQKIFQRVCSYLLCSVCLCFWKKIHPVHLLNFGFFPPIVPKFFSFLFMPWTQKPKNYPIWNYTVRLFHHVCLLEFGIFPHCVFIQCCVFIKIGGIFHPVCLIYPVLLFDTVVY